MNQPFNINDQNHLYRFRMSAASIIRDILSAIDQSDPDVLKEEIRQDWWSDNHRPSRASVQRLLKNASRNLGIFPSHFAGSLDSIPCPDDADGASAVELVEDRVERLRDLVGEFASPDGLKQVVARYGKSEAIGWASHCRLDLLPEIRKLLNSFPETRVESSAIKFNDLTVDEPNIVRYSGRECTKPTTKCFLILKHLLNSPFHAASLDTLWSNVWDKADTPDWGPVDSALRQVRRFFRKNHIPYNITRSVVLDRIWLEKDEPNGAAGLQDGEALEISPEQQNKSTQSPAKKRARRK